MDRLPRGGARAGYADERVSRVTVRFKSHLVENMEEVLTYDLQSLIGEVGGTMGMYLGASILSIVEVLMIKGCNALRESN